MRVRYLAKVETGRKKVAPLGQQSHCARNLPGPWREPHDQSMPSAAPLSKRALRRHVRAIGQALRRVRATAAHRAVNGLEVQVKAAADLLNHAAGRGQGTRDFVLVAGPALAECQAHDKDGAGSMHNAARRGQHAAIHVLEAAKLTWTCM